MSEFKKTEAQKEATKILAGPSRHVALSGGSRSGKSFLLMYALIVRAARVKSRHCVLRLNFNHVKRSIVLETFPKVMSLCFPDLKFNLNKTDYIVDFPNGSQIFFAGLDSGEKVEKILGSEFSTIWLNEISQIPYDSVQIALTRLAEKNDLPKKVYYDMNPSTKSHWSYSLFVKKLDPVDNVPVLNPEEYSYFQMNPSQNMDNIDGEYLKMLEAMPEKERKRFLYGEFGDESQGQVYYSFRRDDHVKEFNKYPGTIWLGEDFNISPGTAVAGQFVDNKFWIFDEVYLENSDTYKMADEFKRRGYGGARICPDSTGKARKTSGQSDFEILKQAGFVIESTHNPLVYDRCNNTNRLFQENRIIIHPRCRKLINDLEKVTWKDGKLDQSGANKNLTHVSDSLCYLLWKLEPFKPDIGQITSSQR